MKNHSLFLFVIRTLLQFIILFIQICTSRSRSISSSTLPTLCSFFFLQEAYQVDFSDPRVLDIVNVLGAVALLFLTITLFFNPYFIVIDGDEIKIAKGYYGYHKFKRSEIQSIEEVEGYSFKILITLMNGKKIAMSSFDMPEKRREEFLTILRA